MKKVFSLVVISMFSFSVLFTACTGGGEQATDATTTEDTTAVAEPAPAAPVDTTAAAPADTTAPAAQ